MDPLKSLTFSFCLFAILLFYSFLWLVFQPISLTVLNWLCLHVFVNFYQVNNSLENEKQLCLFCLFECKQFFIDFSLFVCRCRVSGLTTANFWWPRTRSQEQGEHLTVPCVHCQSLSISAFGHYTSILWSAIPVTKLPSGFSEECWRWVCVIFINYHPKSFQA